MTSYNYKKSAGRIVISCGLYMLFQIQTIQSRVLEVGPGKDYPTPAAAAIHAHAGDTIKIFPGNYTAPNRIRDLKGRPDAYIYLIGTDVSQVIFEESTQSFHFSNIEYVQMEQITIRRQSQNGMNIDDGGDFSNPSRYIKIIGCRFLQMSGQGNNDLLKMSGIDHFEIRNCEFANGANGGSGIDMVGCHFGEIYSNHFENMGSNAIQAKGGSQYLKIFSNKFKNCGQRTLNLGGSTGLEFFRPQDAKFEAADIEVYYNVFIGSTAPIAYVGCVRVAVVNNTILNPGNWVIRILQETVDPQRFESCGNNSFINNLVFHSNSLSRHINIGPNTLPETFNFSHNLWYNHQSPASSAPILPVSEVSGIIGIDPLFEQPGTDEVHLKPESPAIDAGMSIIYTIDYYGESAPNGMAYDIGASEYQQMTTASPALQKPKSLKIYPNPFSDEIRIEDYDSSVEYSIEIYDQRGRFVNRTIMFSDEKAKRIWLAEMEKGIYYLKHGSNIYPIVKIK